MSNHLLEAVADSGSFAVLDDWWTLYAYGTDGGLVAFFHHPNRAACEAKQKEVAEATPGRKLVFRFVHYVQADVIELTLRRTP